jgi:hypothetical protein
MAEYFIRYYRFWQGSPDRFAGPFSSPQEAEGCIQKCEGEFVGFGQAPRNIKEAFRYHILTATDVSRSFGAEFRIFARDFIETLGFLDDPNFAPLPFEPEEIKNKALRRLMEMPF